jgi:hypothetical protein
MKKTDLKGFGLSLLTTFFFGCVFGQSDVVQVSKPGTTGKAATVSATGEKDKKTGPAINEKVSSSFLKSFKTAESLVWSENNEGYIASFYMEGRHTLAWFNKAGRLDCTISYGSAKDLPLQEKKMIQSNYPDYEITATQEVDYNGAHVWVVVVQNCKSTKKVRILDGELYELEHLRAN